jgi:PDZ domain-containing protein
MQQPPPAPFVDPPPPEDAKPKMSRGSRIWSWIAIGFSILVVIVVVAGFVVHLPYTTVSPGSAVSLTKLVTVDGAQTFPDKRGDFRLLYVRERNHVNVWQYLQAKLDSDTEIFKEKEINPTGESQEDQNVRAVSDMALAKIAATKVALQAAGYTVKPASEGLVGLASFPSRPAGKVLKTGDVILEAGGKPVKSQKDLSNAITADASKRKVPLVILRDGQRMNVDVGIENIKGKPSIGVYVTPRYDFPVQVAVDTAGIGGPSGGLAMTLAILDDLTPGDLTGGKRVAVTGTIDADGNVGEIGGIEQKAVAARAAGAKLFLVPQCAKSDPPPYLDACKKDLVRATDRAGKNVKVIPVSTFDDALRVLRENGGDPVETTATTAPKAA